MLHDLLGHSYLHIKQTHPNFQDATTLSQQLLADKMLLPLHQLLVIVLL
jgi:hypothetical protein